MQTDLMSLINDQDLPDLPPLKHIFILKEKTTLCGLPLDGRLKHPHRCQCEYHAKCIFCPICTAVKEIQYA